MFPAGMVWGVDAIVEFSRSGALGPLRIGMTADEVEIALGRPDSSKWVHGEDHWQRYRYGNVSLMLMCGHGEQPSGETLRLTSVRLRFLPLPLRLPAPIAEKVELPWDSARAEDVLAVLRDSGVDLRLEEETIREGEVRQQVRATGQGAPVLTIMDGEIWSIGVS